MAEFYTLEEVLNWINREREAFSIGPPLDYIPPGGDQACNCPIARALGGDDSMEGVFVDPDAGWAEPFREAPIPQEPDFHPIPAAVRLFILDYDSGEYPELVDRSVV